MTTPPAKNDKLEGDAMGEEPEVESGAGYGNHAPDEAAEDDQAASE